VQSLLRFGLIDRLSLWLYPLLPGSGTQVFADGTVLAALRLTESVANPNGALQLGYETAGVPTYGNLAIEERTYNDSPEMASERGRRGSAAPEDPIGGPQHPARTAIGVCREPCPPSRRLTRQVQVVTRRRVRMHAWVSESAADLIARYRPISALNHNLSSDRLFGGMLTRNTRRQGPALVAATVPRARLPGTSTTRKGRSQVGPTAELVGRVQHRWR
jgi:hypothetical protein